MDNNNTIAQQAKYDAADVFARAWSFDVAVTLAFGKSRDLPKCKRAEYIEAIMHELAKHFDKKHSALNDAFVATFANRL